MKQYTSPTIEDHFQKVAMNLRPKTRLFRNLFACCMFVTGLLGSPVAVAQAGSDIVVDGISIKALRNAFCNQLVAEGVTPLPAVCSVGLEDRFVFVTSGGSTSGGNFLSWANTLTGNTFTDGLLAGDAVCQHHADNATPPLSGMYKAWLSTDIVDANVRIGNHRWLLTDGVTVVAEELADLLDCTKGGGAECLRHVIDQDEDGILIQSVVVATGTLVSGVDGTATECAAWTSDNGVHEYAAGFNTDRDFRWTAVLTNAGCEAANVVFLYCFGQ